MTRRDAILLQQQRSAERRSRIEQDIMQVMNQANMNVCTIRQRLGGIGAKSGYSAVTAALRRLCNGGFLRSSRHGSSLYYTREK